MTSLARRKLLELPGARYLPTLAKPFVKWVGGKRQLLPELLSRAPEDLRSQTYFEPFVGGGALFFALAPHRAILADTNERLVRTYRGIQSDVEGVIDRLMGYRYDRDEFYRVRQLPIDTGTDCDVAAWFIYLNRTGFNGLYRVNRRNGFNVPFGRYDNPQICDPDNLRACRGRLKHATILHADFRGATHDAKPGDFVYFDPPYVPVSPSSSFTSYTAGGFSLDDQQALARLARELKSKGVRVLLSNSDSPIVRDLYRDGFVVEDVRATRMVNSVASARGAIGELMIR